MIVLTIIIIPPEFADSTDLIMAGIIMIPFIQIIIGMTIIQFTGVSA